jgi:hypothetical protein
VTQHARWAPDLSRPRDSPEMSTSVTVLWLLDVQLPTSSEPFTAPRTLLHTTKSTAPLLSSLSRWRIALWRQSSHQQSVPASTAYVALS